MAYILKITHRYILIPKQTELSLLETTVAINKMSSLLPRLKHGTSVQS